MPLRPPPNCIAAACIAIVLLAGSAFAAPPDIGRYTNLSGQPTSGQRDAIREYAEHWAAELASSNPSDVGLASKRLASPISAPGVTPIFKEVYSDALLPKLRLIVEKVDEQRKGSFSAVNALKLAGQLGTEDALQVAIDHCDSLNEPRMAVRLWAAIAFKMILERQEQNRIHPRRALPAIRRMGDAAANEDDPRVLVRQFDAISVTDEGNTVEVIFGVLDSVTARLKDQPKATPLFKTLKPAIVGLRDRFLQQRNRELAIEMAPRLAALLEIAEMHWPVEDERLRTGYVATIKVLEDNLQFIDREVNTNSPQSTIKSSDLEKWFKNNDRERYTTELQDIRQELSGPPYR